MIDIPTLPDRSYTVVIPAFNAVATLSDAIGSLRAQSLPPMRIIVVDDGSTDDTPTLAQSLGAELYRQPNGGPGSATTRGLALVQTPYVAFLDADDLWLPHKAAVQLQRFAEQTSLDGCFATLRYFRHGRAVDASAPVHEGWCRSSMMFRTASARRVGPVYDPPFGARGDIIDWISRARLLGLSLEMLPDVLGLRRMIPGSMSYGYGESDRGYLDVARRAIQRRRGLLDADQG